MSTIDILLNVLQFSVYLKLKKNYFCVFLKTPNMYFISINIGQRILRNTPWQTFRQIYRVSFIVSN